MLLVMSSSDFPPCFYSHVNIFLQLTKATSQSWSCRLYVHGIKLAKAVGHWVVVKPFPGATIRDMKSHIVPMIERSPDKIFLHVGTNDLRSSPPNDVADAIVDL